MLKQNDKQRNLDKCLQKFGVTKKPTTGRLKKHANTFSKDTQIGFKNSKIQNSKW